MILIDHGELQFEYREEIVEMASAIPFAVSRVPRFSLPVDNLLYQHYPHRVDDHFPDTWHQCVRANLVRILERTQRSKAQSSLHAVNTHATMRVSPTKPGKAPRLQCNCG
jgi:hypothetical protein